MRQTYLNRPSEWWRELARRLALFAALLAIGVCAIIVAGCSEVSVSPRYQKEIELAAMDRRA
jgi:hypothetical protein